MADSLRDSILQRVVRPEIRSTVMTPTTGQVRATYPDAMRIDVTAIAPWSGAEVILRRIPFLQGAGQANPLPAPGEWVALLFIGSTTQSAVAVSKIDPYHHEVGRARLAHPGKGALLPDL